jgi:methyl-accepting chemotaxis protein
MPTHLLIFQDDIPEDPKPAPEVVSPPSQTAQRLTALFRKASLGQLSERILDVAVDDPLYEACMSANRLLDAVELVNYEVYGAMMAAVSGRYYRHFMVLGINGDFLKVAKSVSQMMDSLKTLEQLLKVGREDIGETANSLNQEVVHRSGMMLSATEELDATSHLLANVALIANHETALGLSASEAALSHAEQIASASEELNASIKEITIQVDQSHTVAQKAVQQVLHAKQVMQDVADAAQSVSHILDVITEIAGQSNVLALNAAIESARAGVAGHGFGVVAAEVKQLARQTHTSTKDITHKIVSVQQAVQRGRSAIEDISAALEQLSACINRITSAIYEQNNVTAEIARGAEQGVSSVRAVTENFSVIRERVSEFERSAKELGEVSHMLSHSARDVDAQVREHLARIQGNVGHLEMSRETGTV